MTLWLRVIISFQFDILLISQKRRFFLTKITCNLREENFNPKKKLRIIQKRFCNKWGKGEELFSNTHMIYGKLIYRKFILLIILHQTLFVILLFSPVEFFSILDELKCNVTYHQMFGFKNKRMTSKMCWQVFRSKTELLPNIILGLVYDISSNWWKVSKFGLSRHRYLNYFESFPCDLPSLLLLRRHWWCQNLPGVFVVKDHKKN